MPKPKIPNQKKAYHRLNLRLARYVALIEEVYDSLNQEASNAALSAGYKDNGKPFRWSDYPQTKQKIQDIQSRFVKELSAVINRSTSEEWKSSNETQDLVANGVLQAYGAQVKGKQYKRYYETNSDALAAFQRRKDNGMNLSKRLWNQAQDYKDELEAAISCAIQKGTSAVTLSKQVSKYLIDFPSLQADYTERFGHAANIRNCQYYSARLARTEINMAYRSAENERWKQMDFVVGQEIKTTQNGKHEEDMCDQLAGKYPKDFVWTGWHPNCYSGDTMVLTARGWLFFRDVLDSDMILSLNPDTLGLEWAGVTARQQYRLCGEMIRFFHRDLECLVTPEHRMVYLGRTSGAIRYMPAAKFRKSAGAFYRGCNYDAEDIASITLSGRTVDFDSYCRFMGYWLACGSLEMDDEVLLEYDDAHPGKLEVQHCIQSLGVDVRNSEYGLEFNDRAIYSLLTRFYSAEDRFICDEILNASKRQIRLFLDAFCLAGGGRRKLKRTHEEVAYYTASPRLAGQLCELLLKVGGRPSFTISSRKQGAGDASPQYPYYRIRECNGTTAASFGKQTVNYDGYVYDLTLERNHIMYVSLGGKCFWGSNCLCYKIPILKTEEEFWADEGESSESENQVTDVPEGFKKWCQQNKERINRAENGELSMPYFVRDNQKLVDRWKSPVMSAEDKKILNAAKDLIAQYQTEYPEVDMTRLETFINEQSFSELAAETAKVKAAVDAIIKKEYNMFSPEQHANFTKLEQALGIKRGRPMSTEKADMQSANPLHVPRFNYTNGVWSRNPGYEENRDKPYSINCATCASAYALRTMGFNVFAKGNTEQKGNLNYWASSNTFDVWLNKDGSKAAPTYITQWAKLRGYKNITAKRYMKFYEEQTKEEGIYLITVNWKSGGGHATILQRFSDGKLYSIEPQEYSKENGVKRDVYKFICERMHANPHPNKGILRVDDKLFDSAYAGLFGI